MILQKIKDFIYKNIGYIALYMAGMQLLVYFFDFFYKLIPNALEKLVYTIYLGDVQLQYLRSDFFTIELHFGNMYMVKSLLTGVFSLLFLIGGILYLKSNKKENRILDFAFLMLFFAKIIAVVTILISIGANAKLFLRPTLILPVLKIIIVLFISYVYLRRSFQQKQLVPIEDELGIKVYLNDDRFAETLHYERASKGQRFMIYLIDLLLIIGLFSRYIFILPRSFSRMLSDTFGDRFSLYILFFIASTFYYLFFEAIFKTTPGKSLINTRIINYKKGDIKFSQFVWRTLSRRIPFEAFSFFGSIGWHDLLSTTTVVKQEADKKYDRLARTVLMICGFLILLTGFLNIFEKF